MCSPKTSGADRQQRRRNNQLIEHGLLGADAIEPARLDDKGCRRPAGRGADHHDIAEHLVRIGGRRRQAEGDDDADEGQQQTEPLRGMEVIARNQPARSDHHEERRQIDKQHRPRRRRPNETAIDQQKLEGEQRTGCDPRRQRAVAFEEGNPAQLRPGADENGGNDRARRRLDQRRDIVDGELDRNLIEAPGQAQRDGQRYGERVKRPGLWGMRQRGSVQFQGGGAGGVVRRKKP